jgi:serine O-acetyltransferase
MKIKVSRGLPSKKAVERFTARVTLKLFPEGKGGIAFLEPRFILKIRLFIILRSLRKRLTTGELKLVREFFRSLPGIRDALLSDAGSIADNDPAASGKDEVIMTYPGFYAIMIYRLANRLAEMGVPMIPRIMTEFAHSGTGIDIHPKAKIGIPFFIDHGTGVVIGETSVIGQNVKLYQGVTIGALSVDHSMAGTKRHPTIEDNVIIYSGSTILGGDTVIGHDSIIGGNVWLTSSVAPYSAVYNQHTVKVRERKK